MVGQVIDKVDERIKTFSNKTSSKFDKSEVQQNNPVNTLNDIHSQIVPTPIDKVNGYVAFLYQQFYTFVLIK